MLKVYICINCLERLKELFGKDYGFSTFLIMEIKYKCLENSCKSGNYIDEILLKIYKLQNLTEILSKEKGLN